MAKTIGIIGLGKMGANLARHLIKKGWKVFGFNRNPGITKSLEKEGLNGAYSLKELAERLPKPCVIWLMIPAYVKIPTGKTIKPVDETLFGKGGLLKYLLRGDAVIDGGNSFYKDSGRRGRLLARRGIHFLDVGVSGGPSGARNGASLMIGGEKKVFEKLKHLFKNLAVPSGYNYFGKSGAGHFVKMVHNGIEYGMMQAIAEGFAIMKKSRFKLNLRKIVEVYNHGSVIESRLIGLLKQAYEEYGGDLKSVSGSVAYTGEGEWTVKTAGELKVLAPVIQDALRFRVKSKKKPSYTGKILSALRNQFGGHSVKNTKTKSN